MGGILKDPGPFHPRVLPPFPIRSRFPVHLTWVCRVLFPRKLAGATVVQVCRIQSWVWFALAIHFARVMCISLGFGGVARGV